MNVGFEKGKYHEGKYYYQSSERLIGTVLVKLVDIKRNYEYLVNRYDEVEKAHQDILHYIEFADLNAVEGYKIYKKLKEIRIERRLIKEELNESKIAYDSIDNVVIEQLTKQLAKTQSECKKNGINFNKTYSPRNCELSGISKEKFENVQKKYNEKLKNEVLVLKK